jgi:hypothetical protein
MTDKATPKKCTRAATQRARNARCPARACAAAAPRTGMYMPSLFSAVEERSRRMRARSDAHSARIASNVRASKKLRMYTRPSLARKARDSLPEESAWRPGAVRSGAHTAAGGGAGAASAGAAEAEAEAGACAQGSGRRRRGCGGVRGAAAAAVRLRSWQRGGVCGGSGAARRCGGGCAGVGASGGERNEARGGSGGGAPARRAAAGAGRCAPMFTPAPAWNASGAGTPGNHRRGGDGIRNAAQVGPSCG